MGQGPRTRELQRSWELLTSQGPRTRDLWRSRELTRQPGRSPRRPPWPPDQGLTGSPSSELPLGTKGRELPGPAPMEMDSPDPPGMARTVQCLVYFISEVLHKANTRHLEVHKLFYAILIASRKLRHHF
jgi:hypothetical protein